jgi:hypothetical protein
MSEQELVVSTVDPIEAALGGQQADPVAPEAGDAAPSVDHPALARYDGDTQKALDAFQELQSTFGREGHRLGQENAALREQLAAYEAQQQPQGQPQDGVPDLQVDQLQDWFAEDPVQATAYLVAQGNNVLLEQIRQEFKAEFDGRLSPIEQTTNRVAKARLTENLATVAGIAPEALERNMDAITAITDSPGFYKNTPETQFNMLKTVVLAAEYEHEHGSTQRGASQNGEAATKNVAVEGGSSGRTPQDNTPTTPLDGFLKELGQPGTKKGLFGLDIAQ